MKKPLDLHKFMKFDVDLFIKEFKKFEIYFKTRVKLINSVFLEKQKDGFKFYLDIPSTDIKLEIRTDKDYKYEPPKKCYYLAINMFPIEIIYWKINKKQFNSILKICKSIYENAKEREEEFKKSRFEVLEKIIKLWCKSKEKIKL